MEGIAKYYLFYVDVEIQGDLELSKTLMDKQLPTPTYSLSERPPWLAKEWTTIKQFLELGHHLELPEGDIEENHLNYPQDSEKDPPQTPSKKSSKKKKAPNSNGNPDSNLSLKSDRDSFSSSPSPYQNRRSKTPH